MTERFILRYSIILTALILVGIGCAKEGGQQKKKDDPSEKKGVKTVLNGTLLRTGTADPCLVYDNNEFFLTMTGSTKIAIVHDTQLSKLTTGAHSTTSSIVYDSSSDPSVKEFYGDGAKIGGTWSPELHYFSKEEYPDYSGWYMYFSLVKDAENFSSVRIVALRSPNGFPEGPYKHPETYKENNTQPLLDKNGKVITTWGVGPSILRIPTGQYKGIYLTWVDEVGRGSNIKGAFYQRLRIAKLSDTKPWQLSSDGATITTPTQEWEKKGSSATYPEVVEGGTAVYGDNGEIFLVYCGSGYWSDYGLGQLTLKRVNGDYADPLKTESWIKYEYNPIFSSANSQEITGAGHAFFLKDYNGDRFMCYHAYPIVGGKKSKDRNAYFEPYTIDYTKKSETAPEGRLLMGYYKTGVPATTSTEIVFYKEK